MSKTRHFSEKLVNFLDSISTVEGHAQLRFIENVFNAQVAGELFDEAVAVGQRETYETALADCQSASRFHVQMFGPDVLEGKPAELHALLPAVLNRAFKGEFC